MDRIEKDFCFGTLALGSRYRLMTKELANDIERYSPGTLLIVGTDAPNDFKENKNILAFKLHQQGILHCYHDKRFVIEKGLAKCKTVIQIDADTRITGDVPEIKTVPGKIEAFNEHLVSHVQKYTPERLKRLENIANKLNIPIEKASFIGEALLIITQDEGKEKEFIRWWGLIGNYLELQGIHAGSGNIIGLAALKVGWTATRGSSWERLNTITNHIDASHQKKQNRYLQNFKRRLGFHYRLNKARLAALKNFDFYYR